MTTKPFTCPHCNKSFSDGLAQRAHHKAKHGSKKMSATIRKQALRTTDDDDDSFAARAIDAELDHAMGTPNPDYDWLVEPYK